MWFAIVTFIDPKTVWVNFILVSLTLSHLENGENYSKLLLVLSKFVLQGSVLTWKAENAKYRIKFGQFWHLRIWWTRKVLLGSKKTPGQNIFLFKICSKHIAALAGRWKKDVSLSINFRIDRKSFDFFFQFFNQLTDRNNILHFCVGWACVIFNFLTMILGSQSLVFR